MPIHDEDALEYHASGRPGKIEVVPTKPVSSAHDLSLAYTPGVAVAVRAIQRNPAEAARLTARGNLVAVVTNGTAVLGLGNAGPLAAKAVMEGKAVLFKKLADVDVFDIELNETDPDRFCDIVEALEPTFGGINLEDIRAPECFAIEARLTRTMNVPVFHDDQHGTAIICTAALLNALEIAGKRAEEVRVVFSGAGAAAMACARMFELVGVRHEHIVMTDRHGVIYRGREADMNEWKQAFAADTDARTLADALRGADVFVGVSVGGLVTAEMVRTMADRPIIFALANPDPEIPYPLARQARPDAIVATGRSDYPNQVNNVLGFPYIFRGALDAGATRINDEMKLAAARALAELAREEVPDEVRAAYGGRQLTFGPDYIIPKPFDPRVLTHVAPAVAEAATRTGVASRPIEDVEAYAAHLGSLFQPAAGLLQRIFDQARRHPARIVFADAEQEPVLRAAEIALHRGIARPILVGDPERVRKAMGNRADRLRDVPIIDPLTSPKAAQYADAFWRKRRRKGVTALTAATAMRNPVLFGLMMLEQGDADGFIAGQALNYPEVLRPALQTVGPEGADSAVCGMYIVFQGHRTFFFADCTVQIDPDAETLAAVAATVTRAVRRLSIEPRVAMLSFSNFGSAPAPQSRKVVEATRLLHERCPDLAVDGEMQVDVAVDAMLREQAFPHCVLDGDANVFIFPDLNSGNIGYKLLHRLGGAEIVGPILLGMAKPVTVLQRNSTVGTVVNLTAMTSLQAAAQQAAARAPKMSER